MLGSGTMFLVLAVFAHPVLRLFGPGYTDVVTALRILALGQLITAATGYSGLALVATRSQVMLSIAVGFGAALNTVLTFALVPSFGINGAAVAGVAASAVTNVLTVFFLWKRARLMALPVPLRRREA